jgi:hypothetical protein
MTQIVGALAAARMQAELGAAGNTKRPTSCVLITPPKAGFDYQAKFDKVVAEVVALTAPA